MVLAVLAPIVVLVVLGVVLAWQIDHIGRSTQWVDTAHTQIARFYELRMRVNEHEGRLRGYLLSGDRRQLDELEREASFDAIASLRELLRSPEQIERLDRVEADLRAWYRLAGEAIARGHLEAREDVASYEQRGELIGRARSQMREATAAAEAVHDAALEDASRTERNAKLAFVSLLGLSALTIAFGSRRQLRLVTTAFRGLVANERDARQAIAEREWVRAGEAGLAATVVGERGIREVASAALDALCAHTGAALGAIYQVHGNELRRVAAHGTSDDVPETLPATRGQLGQALVDRKPRRISGADARHAVEGGLARARTVELLIVPALLDDRAIAVIELGYLEPTGERHAALLASVAGTVALAIHGAEQRARLQDLLEEMQRQGEELASQHEELKVTNEELEQQGTALREAHTRQQAIQHELEAANTGLEEQTSRLEQQRAELLRAQAELEQRAREVHVASQYKSEFLARMSHELRTPLNSSLILARLLADNTAGNLTEEQVRFANTIYSAGNDLLALINDILDLAKIEAGRIELRIAPCSLARVADLLQREFEPVATSRHLAFSVELAPGIPEQIETDEQRLTQILRNLVSNACKFTEHGSVSVAITAAGDDVRFTVRDTGIGIAPHQQAQVFEAFQQVDSSISRRYSGTGLGLAISRDLARLLGGRLSLESEPRQGSTFTLEVPRRASREIESRPHGAQLVPSGASPARPSPARPSPRPEREVVVPIEDDDRERLQAGRRTLLVIEDDPAFAQILRDIARERDFQVLIATTAEAGIRLAQRHRPDGILLDVRLPDRSGLAALERIKREPAIRHIPVHMISIEDHARRSLELGAVGYLVKPATRAQLFTAIEKIEARTARRVRQLLIVEDDARQAEALRHLLGGSGVEIVTTGSVREALDQLARTTFDCVVMDLGLADGTGFELLERMTADDAIGFPPVIVHTGRALTDDEETRLRQFASSIVVKGARSPERLLDEVTLFLHQVEADLPVERQKILREVRDRDAVFENKRVLVVEDDVRNVFALTSILEARGLGVAVARNGREAIEVLARDHVDLILMDVMMPEMDGVEATRQIRSDPRHQRTPIIALTAKAMADDRMQCLQAGANDYLAKPIDVDMLVSLLRVWMPR
jgi:signal transduction histidine kinase/CheY-like chemotaxis protein/CHASE3 domain sensor protein